MRIPSGVTDQYIYFVAVDSTDLKTRETGLSSFTVYRSRNGGAAAAYTTPTINETDTTNMPGVYELLLDEDMTIDSGDDSQEVCLHITQASMAPVTRTFELYRPKITAGETLTASSSVLPTVGAVTGAVGSVTGAVGSVTGAVGSVTGAVGSVTAVSSGAITEASFATTAGSFAPLGILDQGTAQSATGTTIVLRSAAAFANDEILGATVYIVSATAGAGQSRQITDYVQSTDTATVDTWTTTPSGTIVYKIFATPPASATAIPAVNVTQVGGSTTDVSALATNVAAILVDTGTTLDTKLNTIDDFLDTEIAAILADTNELQTDWANGGRLDLLLDSASSAGDPWGTALPGAYGAGTAGKIIGDNINATISSRASQTSVDTVDDLLDTELAAVKTVVDAILVDTAEIGAAGAGLTVLATAAALDTVDNLLDTEVAAIKAKTDSLTFTVANQLDVNMQSVNDVALVGDGSATPWGPA